MYPITTENEKIQVTERYFTMPDGVNLYTRIAVPKGKSKCPIVFIRTPYENAHHGVPHDISEYDRDLFLQNGYGVVLQHCRGKGDSEGTCVPYAERDDGLHSLACIRQLDIYDHELYLFGGSYLSTVHLCYLDTNPEDIKGAVLNIQTDRMYFRNYRNGCCYDFCNYKWWLSMLRQQFPVQNTDGAVKRPYKDLIKRIIGTEYPPFTDMLLHNTYDDFWKNDPRTNVIENLQIPVLFTEGWYDFYIEGMFSMWERLPENNKKRSAFLVGPWGHGTGVAKSAEYPLPNGNIPDNYAVEWFNSLRSGTPYPYAETGKVTYYSIGEDTWKTAVYPLQSPAATRLYFSGDHTLNTVPSDSEAAISYVYDPEQQLNCHKFHNIFQAADTGSNDGVVSFLSAPFAEDRHFFGKIRWHMPVSSDCDDTAFFIRVYFVEGDASYNLTETITSLSHIQPNYQAGERLTIDLFTPPIAFRIRKGGKIRVDISSDGGIYVPHANVKGHWAQVCETKIANNTVYTKDSFLELFAL